MCEKFSDFVDHSHDDTDPISIDSLLNQMDDVYNESAEYRNILLRQIMETVKDTRINPFEDDADDVEKKIMIYDQANKLLSEKEKAFTTRINTRLKQKETDSNVIAGQMAVDLLKKIKLTNVPVSNPGVPSLEDQLSKLDTSDIESSNAILDTELKTDPKDIPMLSNIDDQKEE